MFHHRIDAETSSNKLTVHSVLKQHILLNHIQFNKQLPHGTSILYPSTPFKFKSKRLDCFFSNRVEKYKSNCSCSPMFKVRIPRKWVEATHLVTLHWIICVCIYIYIKVYVYMHICFVAYAYTWKYANTSSNHECTKNINNSIYRYWSWPHAEAPSAPYLHRSKGLASS